MGAYARWVLPNLISCACGAPGLAAQRRRLVPQAEGVVLELGLGSGLNLPYYDPARVTRVYGLEPEAGMLIKARRHAADAPVPVEVLAETAEALSLPDASVDTVLVTFSLCTIPDVAAALTGARRVLRPGGRFLFCEHGAAPDPKVRRLQARLDPLWGRVFGGCRLTRDIPALIRDAGFNVTRLDADYLPGAPRFAGYLYRGEEAAA